MAQATDSAMPAGAEADTAVLVLQRRPIITFRAPLGAMTAAERASRARQRIQAIAESAADDSVSTRMLPEGLLVSVGPRGVFTITHADLDTLGGETLDDAAAQATARLRVALAEEREQRSIAHLLWAVGLAIVATLLFVIALRLLRAVHRAAIVRLRAAPITRRRALRVAGFTLLDADQILAFARRAVDLIVWGLGLFLGYIWLAFVLTRFAFSRPWGEALGSYLVATLKSLGLGALGAIPGLFTVVVILLATRFLARLVATFFAAVERGDVVLPWVHTDTAQPTRRIVTALLWLFALVIAYPYLPGSESNVFRGVSVFVGVMLSLGSTGLVNQAMSGLVLMYARAFGPGDYVRVGETEGTVTELGMLATKMLTTRGEVLTIPNAVMISHVTTNYSRGEQPCGAALSTSMTIGYDTPWRQVEALMLEAARRTPGVLQQPPPFVRTVALQDFYVEYQLNVFVEQGLQRPPTHSALHSNLLDCFNEQGVQIMSPHYEHDPAAPKVVPRDRWFAPPAKPGA